MRKNPTLSCRNDGLVLSHIVTRLIKALLYEVRLTGHLSAETPSETQLLLNAMSRSWLLSTGGIAIAFGILRLLECQSFCRRGCISRITCTRTKELCYSPGHLTALGQIQAIASTYVGMETRDCVGFFPQQSLFTVWKVPFQLALIQHVRDFSVDTYGE